MLSGRFLELRALAVLLAGFTARVSVATGSGTRASLPRTGAFNIASGIKLLTVNFLRHTGHDPVVVFDALSAAIIHS